MAQPSTTQETLTLEQAVVKLSEISANNVNRIGRLETQIDEICKNFEEYREKVQVFESITTTLREETRTAFEEMKRQWDDMYKTMRGDMNTILIKLGENLEPSAPRMITMPKMELKQERAGEREERKHELDETHTTDTSKSSQARPVQATTVVQNYQRRRSVEMSPFLIQEDIRQQMPISSVSQYHPVKHSIIVPPASAAPAFYGKQNESPTQFLIRVQEYAESVHAWDRNTLVNGISQFLRDSALEWYCQLRLSHRRPGTWTEFEDLFLAQFNSPVRKARQEQEWHECKQKEDETINEFLVRLRALWREQKPKETERDLVKHLFCRMRNDLLNMIGVSRNASLDEVITEVQQIEDILYRRAKGERLAKHMKQTLRSNTEISSNKRYNEDYTHKITPERNKEDSYNNYGRRTKNHQVNEVPPNYYNQGQTTGQPNMIQQVEQYSCFRCGNYGHWARDCPNTYGAYRQERNKLNSKNIYGALDERTSRAPY